ncbi:MAG: cytochrome c3 family protein [Polyangiaceae bacterium]
MRSCWLAVTLVLAAACGGSSSPAKSPTENASGVVTSNIARGDYAGTASCRHCHADIYDSWTRAPMHNMTRLPATMNLDAPFDGHVFHFKNDSATLITVSGDRYMQIDSPKHGAEVFRVTKVIGGHYREDFAGLQVDAAQKNARVFGDSHDEIVLPVSYLLATKTLRYKGYSVMTPERDGLKAGPTWNRTCIFCHNTAPYLSSMLGALAGSDAKPYQGEVVDALLPAERRARFEVTDDDALRDAVGAEISFLHGSSEKLALNNVHTALISAIDATRADFWEKDLVEVGIGCESCHGGAREHVKNPSVKPSFLPHAPFVQGSDTSASGEITRTCARCHQVLFSGYPFTWEGGRRNEDDRGGSHINSGEGRDFLMGHCSEKMSCVDCHDPHAPGNEKRIRELEDTHAGNAVCVRCHAKYDSDEALQAHAHHDPKGEGGKCMNCHMPKKNMSLGGVTTRYHRIGSPTDRDRVERDRPLECALCHEKKSVREILGDMKKFWNVTYDENKIRALYGENLDQNAILATLATGKPHEKAPALFVAGQTKMKTAAGYAEQELTGPYPIVRGYALRALESMTGESAPFDPLAEDDAKIAEEASVWLAKHDLGGAHEKRTTP